MMRKSRTVSSSSASSTASSLGRKVKSSTGGGTVMLDNSANVIKKIKTTSSSNNNSNKSNNITGLLWIQKKAYDEDGLDDSNNSNDPVDIDFISSQVQNLSIEKAASSDPSKPNLPSLPCMPYEEAIGVAPLASPDDWINRDLVERYRQEYKVLGDRMEILQQTYSSSLQRVESLQECMTEKSNRLNRLKLSQTEIEQKLAFYQAQKQATSRQVLELETGVQETELALQKESDNLLLTRSSLAAVQKNHDEVKRQFSDWLAKTRSHLENLNI